ncbi:hypothetical protein L1987_04440 [Smallanthus sonchifolius]|uniref:Uncharacterized protein n=1 Tax=Smallanthus sonchifolius TaxID=185202 RepID=A0ACB9KDG4_9ASTR|nr:hypothetical protein L1987_04440 [Smallanthus sonchifolius]
MDDDSLRRWKEQLLGVVDGSQVEEVQEPDIKIPSLTIISPDRPDIVLEIPTSGNPKAPWFTLKEGSKYNLKFSIKVSNDIVCGLKYNQVWKMGLKVDNSKEMLGTFSPQAEPYTHLLPEKLLLTRAKIETCSFPGAAYNPYRINPAEGIGQLTYLKMKKSQQSIGDLVYTIFCWDDAESEAFWLKQTLLVDLIFLLINHASIYVT